MLGGPAASAEPLDPVGAWSCVLFGHPAFGDEHVMIAFERDHGASLARVEDGTRGRWLPLTRWKTSGSSLEFEDFRTGRRFSSDLTRPSLGGVWRTESLVGGWWCRAADGEIGLDEATTEVAESDEVFPPLIPDRMAMPSYPRSAVRAAKEGRVVACFHVDSDGYVLEPEVIEASDEVFEQPTLEALGRSRYRGWSDRRVVRPACRTYLFELDSSLVDR